MGLCRKGNLQCHDPFESVAFSQSHRKSRMNGAALGPEKKSLEKKGPGVTKTNAPHCISSRSYGGTSLRHMPTSGPQLPRCWATQSAADSRKTLAREMKAAKASFRSALEFKQSKNIFISKSRRSLQCKFSHPWVRGL